MNKVNKQKYFVKWIEIQTAAFKFSSEQIEQSEQGEQSEQTHTPDQMNWDSDSLFQILQNKWTSEQSKMLSKKNWKPESFIQIVEKNKTR